MEPSSCTTSAPAGLLDPIAQYDHDEGLAIVGGFVYRGLKIPALQGAYIFGDFARSFSNDGRLFYLDGSNTIVEFVLVGQPALNLALLGFGRDAKGGPAPSARGTALAHGIPETSPPAGGALPSRETPVRPALDAALSSMEHNRFRRTFTASQFQARRRS